MWQKHLFAAQELLSTFKERDALYTELIHPAKKTGKGQVPRNEIIEQHEPTDIESLSSIKKLSAKVKNLEEFRDAISDLDKQTKEMINLVRILGIKSS